MNEIVYLVVDEANAEAHGLNALTVRSVTPVIKPWELNELNGSVFNITPEALRSDDGTCLRVLNNVGRDVRHPDDQPDFGVFMAKST